MRYSLMVFMIIVLNFQVNGQWTQLNTDTIHNYSSVYFLNSDTGFICGFDDPPYDGIILRTLDGGDTWDTTRISPGFWLMDIQFINDSTAIAGGHDGGMIRTTDLGNTWSYYGSCAVPYDFTNLHFLNSDTAFIQGFGGDLRRYTPLSPPTCVNYINTMTQCFFPRTGSLDFLDFQIGYVTGGNGQFVKTTDRGLTWNHFNCDTNLYILGGKMTNPNHIVVVGNEGKYSVTNDGGLNWSSPVSLQPQPMTAVDFYNSQVGYCVGGYSSYYYILNTIPNGIIWYTLDGGNSWSLVDSSYSDQLVDISIVNDSLAFAVGLNGTILRNQSHYTSTGVATSIQDQKVKIFPNPFINEINIELSQPHESNYSYMIRDIWGKVVKCYESAKTNGSKQITINTGNLSPGIYIMHVLSNKKIYTYKVIKQE